MKTIKLVDIFSTSQLTAAYEIGPDHQRLLAEITQPNLESISEKCGQEMSADYLAYMLEFFLMKADEIWESQQ